jgi:hypothetical protein
MNEEKSYNACVWCLYKISLYVRNDKTILLV